MRRIREVLRLKHECALPNAQIAAALGIAKGSVANYLAAATAAGLTHSEAQTLDDAALNARLHPQRYVYAQFAVPDFGAIHRELRRKGVTLQLLWEEYRAQAQGVPYSRSRFCERYIEFRQRLRRSMRQIHVAGEKLFVDYAGPTVPLIDPASGEITRAHIFVAVWGASNYTYAEATATESKADWIAAHVNALTFFGGAPALLVPDNPRALIRDPDRYEPIANRTYEALAEHYGCAILPARPRKPQDKAKVEAGGAAGRALDSRPAAALALPQPDRTQYRDPAIARANSTTGRSRNSRARAAAGSICSIGRRCGRCRAPPSSMPTSNEHGSRVSITTSSSRTTTTRCRMPWSARKSNCGSPAARSRCCSAINAWRVTPARIAAAATPRSPEHMPAAHRAHREWTPARLLHWAGTIGIATGHLVAHLLESKPHPEQGYRACLGLLALARKYGDARLEAGCARALALGAKTRKSVASILAAGLDRQPTTATLFADTVLPAHANVRGPEYYH